MNTLMVTVEKSFEDPSNEAKASVAFAIVWNNSGFGGRNEVISPFGWSISKFITEYKLRDRVGEVRPVSWGQYHEAVESADWAAYDAVIQKKEIQKLKDEIVRLKDLLRDAGEVDRGKSQEISKYRDLLYRSYDENEVGGPGSRKRVRQLLLETGIRVCDSCGKACCNCDDGD